MPNNHETPTVSEELETRRKIITLMGIMSVIILISIMILLAIYSKDEPKITHKELIFIEKTTEYDEPHLIFESKEDKAYYFVKVDNYTYDNLNYKQGDTFRVKSKPYHVDYFTTIIETSIISDYAYLAEEKVYMFDEWIKIHKLTKYMRNDDENITTGGENSND